MTSQLLSAYVRLTSVRDERGASAVEYGLLITGIAALIVLTVYLFGSNVGLMFSDTCDKINNSRGLGNC